MTDAPKALRMGQQEWLLLILLSVMWGASFFFYKVMTQELPPITIVLGRLGIAAIVLNLIVVARGERLSFPARTWPRIALLAIINNALPFTLIATSETRITSSLAAIVSATTPILTAITAHMLTHDEKLRWNKAVGIAVGFVGAAIVIGGDVLEGLGSQDLIGELICLAASVSYAFSGVYSRHFHHLAPLKVATAQVTAGALILLPIALVVDQPWTLPMPSAPVWGSLLGIALMGTALAYLLFFRIVGRIGASNMSLVAFLQPVSALLLGWIGLGEIVSWQALAGMGVIALGMALIDGRPLGYLRRA